MHEFAFYSLPVQLPVFGAGLILYRLLGPDRATLRRLERWLPASACRRAILIALVVLAVGLPLRLGTWPPGLIAGIPGHLGYGVLFALLGYALATDPLGMLVNPVSRFFGRICWLRSRGWFRRWSSVGHCCTWSGSAPTRSRRRPLLRR